MRQVAAAVMSLREHANGSHQIEIALHPATLGKVQVRLVRAEGAATRVEVTVARPEALAALRHDMPGLHRALDAAGIPPAHRDVSIQLAPPAMGTAMPGDIGPQSTANGGTGENEPNRYGHHGSGPAAAWQPWPPEDETVPLSPAMPRSARRGGIDITA